MFRSEENITAKRKRVILLAVTGIVALILFAIMSTSLLVVDAVNGMKVRSELLDCTEPSGECFQEGQERTGVVIEQLLDDSLKRETITRDVVILAAICADEDVIRSEPVKSKRITLMEKCVNDQLGKGDQ